MKTLDAIKKAIKMNETLKEFGLEEKYIALEINGNRIKVNTLKELKKYLSDEYVKEFWLRVLDVELDNTFEASGLFLHNTYNGRPYIWDCKYEVKVIVA